MTRDSFRREQKKMCLSGAPNHVGIYGCPCCRMTANLNSFKKESRKLAKVRSNREALKDIQKQRDEE